MTKDNEARRPRAFTPDDPAVVTPPAPARDEAEDTGAASRPEPAGGLALPTLADVSAGFRWGQMLLSAALALAALAAGIWFARFVSVALARDDLLGWLAWGLASLIVLAGVMLAMREALGLLRLSRLGSLRRDAEAAVRERSLEAERRVAARLTALFAGRADSRWGRARLGEHIGEVRDPGDLLRLAESELLAPQDVRARGAILASAKRVAMVTAISPMTIIAMLFVLVENLRLLRILAALYGGRPGLIGGLRLARMVVGHIIASGGIALTDDLLGQFLGQDILRRLSTRLGEGAFNGALTARVGVAAVDVIRPLPYLASPPIRLRDIVGEMLRRRKDDGPAAADPGRPDRGRAAPPNAGPG